MSTDQNIRPPAYHSAQATEDVAQKLARDLGSPIEDVRQALGLGAPRAASSSKAAAPKAKASKAKAKAKRKASRGR